jgi:oligoribonuclease NrnB/cAMP/cGMP phosphodiesterase (DHH superfamily)
VKTYVLYHANCADGFGAALCAWLKFGDEAEYIPVSHGQPIPQMEDGSNVYILDFSYTAKELGAMCYVMNEVVVLDHHETARKELEGCPFATFDMTKSGARLAWEHFFPRVPAPVLIRYIEDRDLWKWDLPDSRAVNAALASYEKDFRLWNNIRRHGEEDIIRLATEGDAILRMLDVQVKQQCRNARLAAIYPRQQMIRFMEPDSLHSACVTAAAAEGEGCYVVPAVNATCFVSEVGHELLQEHPDAQFVAMYLDKADGSRVWSLRSRKDFDCSPIAKAWPGGGGHKQACGFTQKGGGQ